jgi:hypothetical protein
MLVTDQPLTSLLIEPSRLFARVFPRPNGNSCTALTTPMFLTS